MPARRATSDSDDNISSKKRKGSVKKKANSDVDEEIIDIDAGEGGQEEEVEYEIEAILDHSTNALAGQGSQTAYYCKWKGYGTDDNSWVKESDAGGAAELIREYWSKQKNAKKGAAISATSSSRKNKPKASSPEVESEDDNRPKKRGRTSMGGSSSARKKPPPKSDSEMDVEEEVPPKKAPRKSNGTASIGRKPTVKKQEDEDDEALVEYASKTLPKKGIWESQIQDIDTVERSEEGFLIYFTTADGNRYKERSHICHEKFPLKLLEFYESHLKWQVTVES